MPIFSFTDKDGKDHEINAPDQKSAVAAFKRTRGPKTRGEEWFRESDRDYSFAGTYLAKTAQGLSAGSLDNIIAGISAIPQATKDWASGEGFDIKRGYRDWHELQNRRLVDMGEKQTIASMLGTGTGLVSIALPGGLALKAGAKGFGALAARAAPQASKSIAAVGQGAAAAAKTLPGAGKVMKFAARPGVQKYATGALGGTAAGTGYDIAENELPTDEWGRSLAINAGVSAVGVPLAGAVGKGVLWTGKQGARLVGAGVSTASRVSKNLAESAANAGRVQVPNTGVFAKGANKPMQAAMVAPIDEVVSRMSLRSKNVISKALAWSEKRRAPGPGATVLDAHEGLEALANDSVNATGRGQALIRQTKKVFDADFGNAIKRSADTLMGPQVSSTVTLKNITERQRTNARAAYDAAFDAGIVPDREILSITRAPEMTSLLNGAAKTLRTKLRTEAGRTETGLSIEDVDAAVKVLRGATPESVSARLPQATGRLLHQVKIALREGSDRAFRTGHGARGNALGEVHTVLRGRLHGQNPLYGQADKAFAEEMDLRRAVDLGREALKSTTWAQHPDEFAESFATLGTEAERELFRVGLRDGIEHLLDRSRRDTGALSALLSDHARAKLAFAFGDEPAGRFVQDLGDLVMRRQTFQKVTGGSPTKLRQDLAEAVEGIAARADRTTKAKIFDAITESLLKISRTEAEAVRAEIAPLLVRPAGDLDAIVSAIARERVKKTTASGARMNPFKRPAPDLLIGGAIHDQRKTRPNEWGTAP